MTAARIHKLEVSSVEVAALVSFCLRVGPTIQMLEQADERTETMTGLLTLMMICERANKG